MGPRWAPGAHQIALGGGLGGQKTQCACPGALQRRKVDRFQGGGPGTLPEPPELAKIDPNIAKISKKSRFLGYQILRQISKPVDKVGSDEQNLMRDMLETMYAANGIGLAAIQIGVPKRIIVMDISKDENRKQPMYFVNPVVKNKNKEKSY